MNIKLSVNSKIEGNDALVHHYPHSTEESFEIPIDSHIDNCQQQPSMKINYIHQEKFAFCDSSFEDKADRAEMSEFSLMIRQGLQRARIQSKREEQIECLEKDYQKNLAIERQQYEQMQKLVKIEICKSEESELVRKIQTLQKQILSLRQKGKNKNNEEENRENNQGKINQQTFIAELEECLQNEKKVENGISERIKQSKKMQVLVPRAMTFTRTTNRTKYSKVREHSVIKNKNNSKHKRILEERAIAIQEYNRDLLESFLRRLEKLEFENSLLNKELDFISKQILSMPSYYCEMRKGNGKNREEKIIKEQQQYIRKRTQAEGVRNRTPRFMSQEKSAKNDNDKNNAHKNRFFMFQRERASGLLAERRSLSKNSGKSVTSIKNRARSSYSKGFQERVQPRKITARLHPQVRGEYFEQEKQTDQTKLIANP